MPAAALGRLLQRRAVREEKERERAPVIVRCAECARRHPLRTEDFEPRLGIVGLGPSTGGIPLGRIAPPLGSIVQNDGWPPSRASWWFVWLWHVSERTRRQWIEERRLAEATGTHPPVRRPPAYMDALSADFDWWYREDPTPGVHRQSRYVPVPCAEKCASVELRCHRCRTRSREPIPMKILQAVGARAQQEGSWWASFIVTGFNRRGFEDIPRSMLKQPGLYSWPALTVWFDARQQAPFSMEPPTADLGRLLRWPWPGTYGPVPMECWRGHTGS